MGPKRDDHFGDDYSVSKKKPEPAIMETKKEDIPAETKEKEAPIVKEVPKAIKVKDTLIIMCSGTGCTSKVLDHLHKNLGLGNVDYDLLAVPGGAHSLMLAVFLPKFRWSMERWVKYLMEGHSLKRVILIDHEGCSWFKKLAVSESSIMGKAQKLVLGLAIGRLVPLLPHGTVLEVLYVSPAGDDVKFEKIK